MRLYRLAVLLAVFAGISTSAEAQYTSRSKSASSGFTTKAAAQQATSSGKQATTQAVFRPRPEQSKNEAADDDELPSFEALESKNSAAAQNANAPSVPPPPPPKGEIWIYKTNFHYENLTGMPETMNCNWDVVVQNKTDTTIDKLTMPYYLFNKYFVINVSSLAPNASFVDKNIIYSPQCPAMGQTKPKLSITKCKMGGLKDQECLKYIVLK
ncbi:MAG: hypothetical protein IKR09_05185 [Alphaproteobacteria bacterium]|nr:hypothetical protein [Alphaproteobacteria bacterium]